jgi:AcrR family transcriptional regulator
VARRPGSSLAHADVVQAGITLADAVGLEGVTLGGVAARLGVQPPSLYNHVAGLTGLRRALALWGLRELTHRLERAAVGKAGDDALLALAHTYRGFAREHPGVYAATLRAPEAGDAEWASAGAEVVGIVLAVLAGYSLEAEDALHATRGLRSVLHGFVSLEAAGGFGLPLNLDESFARLLQVFIAGLRQPGASGAAPQPREIVQQVSHRGT